MLGDSVDFVGLWYGAQKIGAVTAEAYTFLQPKDYAYYLEHTRRCRRRRIDDRAGDPRGAEGAVGCARSSSSTTSTTRAFATCRIARGRADHEGRHCNLEVHDRLDRTAEGGRPSVHSAVLSCEWYAKGVLDLRRGCRPPGPEALLRLRARLAALFPSPSAPPESFSRASTPEKIFELIAEHRPTVLVNVPTMMAQMVGHPNTISSCLASAPAARRCRGALRPPARDVRRRGAGRDRPERGVPHLHLQPTRACAPARQASSSPATTRTSPTTASSGSRATRALLTASTRSRSRRSPAT